MLSLISLGLFDVHDMSYKAIKIARKCDVLYLENYTSLVSSAVDIEKFLNRKVVILERENLENNSIKLINEAKDKNVGLLVGGDCLSATTHVSLLLECGANNVEYKVVHGSSVFTAVAESGLSLYNFGKTVSVPFNLRDLPSVIDGLKGNLSLGLHTLFLLDLNPRMNKYLDAKELLKFLHENGYADYNCVVCGALGGNSRFKFGKIKDLIDYSLGVYPQSVILLGNLHFIEEEALLRYK